MEFETEQPQPETEQTASVDVDATETNWTSLKASDVIRLVKRITDRGLLAVLKREEAEGKGRSTVLAAIDAQIEDPEPEAPPVVVDDGLPHVHRPFVVIKERDDEVFLKVDNCSTAQGTWVRKVDLETYEGF